MTRGSAQESRRSRRKHWSPLWWALPLAFVFALPLLALASLEMCGISGCTGGGFGVTDIGRGAVIPILAVSGLVLGLPLVLTRWHPRLGVRLAVGLGVAVIWTGVMTLGQYSQV